MSLAYREAGPADGPVALLVHGFPQSSYMWREVTPALADAGWRALAPDLAGFGDSPVDPPGTWERQPAAASVGVTSRHMNELCGKPWTSSATGPSVGPASRCARVTPGPAPARPAW